MFRWLKRLVLTLLLLAVVVAAPIAWVEGVCTAPRDPGWRASAPLVKTAGYARREADSYLTYPEWHIVYAYEDLAGVLRGGDESDFAYGGQILGFWRSLCGLTGVVTARGGVPTDTKVMLYTIGWSFTAEMALKGGYENTLGRLFEWLRGPRKTAEDEFVARDMQAYATFLRQTPWYAYPFARRLAAFWWRTPLGGDGLARKLERRAVVTAEYGVRAVYGALMGVASATALGTAEQEIHSVVAGLDAAGAARDARITLVGDLGGGRTLIRTPRYRAFTEVVVGLARQGRDLIEIAGNQRILVTALVRPGPLPSLPGATPLFEAPIQSRPDRRRVGLDVTVPRLAATIRALESAGAAVEHVYDY
jgi:hypothetical protein